MVVLNFVAAVWLN